MISGPKDDGTYVVEIGEMSAWETRRDENDHIKRC